MSRNAKDRNEENFPSGSSTTITSKKQTMSLTHADALEVLSSWIPDVQLVPPNPRIIQLEERERKTSDVTLSNNIVNLRPKEMAPVALHDLDTFDLTQEGSHLDKMGGFFVIIREDTVISYVSQNCRHYTKWQQCEMIGKKLSEYVEKQDHAKIEEFLSRKKSDLPPKFCKDVLYPKVGKRLFFHFRLKTERDFNHFNLMGNFRLLDQTDTDDVSNGDYIFLGLIRPVKDRPVTELSLLESIQDQYITRHLPDGKIIYADHRISTACGYLPSDVIGISGFFYIFGEDLIWSAMANRQMFASTSGEGKSTYRLLCKDGSYIIVQTKGYLEFNPHTQKVDSFMCINTVVGEEEGKRFLELQKERFTPYVLKYKSMVEKEDGSKKGLRKRTISSSSGGSHDDDGLQDRQLKYRTNQEGNRVIDAPESNGIDEISQVAHSSRSCSSESQIKLENLLNLMNNPDQISAPTFNDKRSSIL